jgi:hypothetical protein
MKIENQASDGTAIGPVQDRMQRVLFINGNYNLAVR